MTASGRISTNAAYQLLAQAGLLVLGFIASPILVKGLGLELYGLLIIVGVATNYFGFVEMGLGRATVQSLAHHRARGEDDDVREVLWTSTAAFLVLSLLGALALLAAAPLLVRRVLAISPPLVPQALAAFGIGAAGLVVAMQRDVAASVATAMERFDLLSRVTLAIGVLQAGLNIAIVLGGGSLAELMLGGIALQTLALIVYWRISSRLVPRLFPPRVRLEKLRELVRFGSYVTVSQLVSPLLVHLGKVLIGAYAAIDQVPYYAVSYSLAMALTIVPTSLGNVIYPAMARLMSNGDIGGVRETLRRSTRYCFVIVVGPVVLLVLYAHEILAAWMGQEFASNASGCLRVLSVATLISVLAAPSYQLLQAAGRSDVTARYRLLDLALHVPISVVAISRAGVLGAAVAWLLLVLLDTSLLFRAAARVAGVPGWLLLRDSFGRGIVAAVVCFPVALGARWWVEVSGRVETLILLGLLGAGYASPVAWLGLGRDERRAMLDMLKGMVAGTGRAPA